MKRYRFSLKDCNVTYTEHIFTVQIYSNCASVVHVGVCVCMCVCGTLNQYAQHRQVSDLGQNKNMNFGSTKF